MSKLSDDQHWNIDLVFPLRVDHTVSTLQKWPSQRRAMINTRAQLVKFSTMEC